MLRRLLAAAALDITPFRRHRDFRLLLIGQTVSLLGGQITYVAIPYQVYRLTHSTVVVGLIGLAEIIPVLGLAFLAGALADALDRRRMVRLTEFGLALVSAILVANALLPIPQVWLIFLAAAAAAGLDALQRPSLDAMMPRLVDRDEITAAGALESLRFNLGGIVGPAAGGVLIASIGLPATFALDVISFVGSLTALSLMRAIPPPLEAERPSIRRVVEGIRYARGRPDLMGTYLVDMVAMFFGMPEALFPALAVRFGGPGVLGLLFAAPAVGSLIAIATSGWSNHVYRYGRAIVLAAAAWGLAVVGLGLSVSLPGALLFLALAGAADMVSGLFRSAIWNRTIPDSLRGRLASIEMLSYSTGPAFGNLEAGAVAAIFSLRASILSGGALCVLGSAALAFALPAFWRFDIRDHASHGGPSPGAG